MKIVLFLGLLLSPCIAFAECTKYEIVDYGDRVEAVCVGQPLTPAEEEKYRQDSAKRDKEIAAQKQAQKQEREQEEIKQKLSKVKCSGDVADECGPGRECNIWSLRCRTHEEAARSQAETQQIINRSQTQQIINQLGDIDRKLKYGF